MTRHMRQQAALALGLVMPRVSKKSGVEKLSYQNEGQHSSFGSRAGQQLVRLGKDALQFKHLKTINY